MTALAALLGALFVIAACYQLGSAATVCLSLPLRRWEKPPIAFLLGAAILHLAIFAVMALQITYPFVLVAVIAGAILSGFWRSAWRLPESTIEAPLPLLYRVILAIAGAAFAILYLFNAWAPEISPDGASYHLGFIRRYLAAHGFEAIPTNFLSTLGQGTELLFAPAIVIGGFSSAALLHLAFLGALVMLMITYARRYGFALAGCAAALLVTFSPMVGVDATSAYVDLAAAATVFGVFFLTRIWEGEPSHQGLLIALGLLGGYCYAVKYTAAILLVYAVGIVAWKTRRMAPVVLICVAAAVMIGPWMAKNWILVGNPVAPFGNAWFRNPFIHVELERSLAADMRSYGVSPRWMLLPEVTLRGVKTGGLIGPVFLLSPLALLALLKKEGRKLLLPAALLFATYFSNVGSRFLIPLLPFVSLALAMAVGRLQVAVLALVVFHGIASWPTVLARYYPGWRLEGIPWKAALRIIPEQEYLNGRPDYQWARMVETQMPAGEQVLLLSEMPYAYTSRNVLIHFQGALNQRLRDAIDLGWARDFQPRRLWIASVPELHARKLRLVQEGTARIPAEQWSIHELRFYDHGKELPRLAEWRMRTWPNPWDVGLAFDNSQATRWRSWETLAPGMSMEIDFGHEVAIDKITAELSGDEWDAKMRVEVGDGNGWKRVDAAIAESTVTLMGSIRMAGTAELRANRVNYILVKDYDWGAKDFAQASSWGMTRAAYVAGGALYRIEPREEKP